MLKRGGLGLVIGWGLALLAGAALPGGDTGQPKQESGSLSSGSVQEGSRGCLVCHVAIEEMHPAQELSCVDCHGGDAQARTQSGAHVSEPRSHQENERVAPLKQNLAWRRFQNPMDLRVAKVVCGDCHEQDLEHLMASLHVSTAGHLSDGYYEMGLSKKRGSRFAVFPVSDAPREGGEVSRLVQVPKFSERGAPDQLSTHYSDLPRKECMQCHLWSEGRAVKGRVGFDGDYRGEGCAACHVPYAIDGFSESADPTVPKNEPGHPRTHTLVRAATTETCTSCHYGDASIGLHFRGLSQLPPEAPGGPEIPGTTDRLLNRVFYLNDPAICPPDIHYERGMHCVDCHTKGDVMGDGMLHGQMEHAVEISCEACHGTFTRISQLQTERGTPLENLRRGSDGTVVLTSKITGEEHTVPQVVNVLDPDRPEYNARAAAAMTASHANTECYACHAAWNVNFLGFHFSRNESLSQLDLITGKRTPGRVTTQEKVFSTWKSFYAGLNERGRVAPYLTGFSTMGSVWDEKGDLIIDQEMPVTVEGLSGMTMVHHQLHSTRPTARQCVECHRAPSTWGLGSSNFQLARRLAFVADRRGVEVVAMDRREPTHSAALAKVVLPDVVAIAADCDSLQGYAHHLYVAEGQRGIHVIDVREPTKPVIVKFVATEDPQGLFLAGDTLWVADGIGGVRALDVSVPEEAHVVGHVATFDAQEIDVRWPWAFVADGPGGLAILDIQTPIAPSIISALDVNGPSRRANESVSVATLFQYSRPMSEDERPIDRRTQARNLACVVDRRLGLITVDVTEPTHPSILWPKPQDLTSAKGFGVVTYRGLALASQVDLAERQGGTRTVERDYAYVQQERGPARNRRSQIVIYNVSDPEQVKLGGALAQGYETEGLMIADYYNPPFRQRFAFSPGERGLLVGDVTTAKESTAFGALSGIRQTYAVAIESFPLDRMIDENGNRLKDISHPESRWLRRDELLDILLVKPEKLGLQAGARSERARDAIDTVDTDYGGSVRHHLAASDKNRTGVLEGEEIDKANARAMDFDGDDRITLFELAREGGQLGLSASEAAPQPPTELLLMERLDVDGDLARLFDRVNPWEFDRDNDNALGERELKSAAFAALDLDKDQRLSQDELSRYPGVLRGLRYRGTEAQELFSKLDRNSDGALSSREFVLQKEELHALDPDGDREVQLVPSPVSFYREAGLVLPGSEWPSRRPLPMPFLPLPPTFNTDQFMARFDKNDDGVVSIKELGRRDGLFEWLDARDAKDSRITRADLDKGLRVFTRLGVDACLDDFVGRWDVDRSGQVDPEELPLWVR